MVTQSQVANELDEDANKADATSLEQNQVERHVNEDLQNQTTSVNVNSKYRLNVDEINPLELSEEPIWTMETDVKAGAIEESSSVLQPLNESAVGDDSKKVRVKRLESFNAKRLRIPKRRDTTLRDLASQKTSQPTCQGCPRSKLKIPVMSCRHQSGRRFQDQQTCQWNTQHDVHFPCQPLPPQAGYPYHFRHSCIITSTSGKQFAPIFANDWKNFRNIR